MRKVLHMKNFSPDAAFFWYLAALTGLLLFCFAPLTPPHSCPVSEDDGGAQTTAVLPSEETVGSERDFQTVCADCDDAYPVFLMQGDRGAGVRQLQTQLLSLGYDVGDCSGVYTAQTASAVRRFQLDCGLAEDGICTASVSYAAAYLSGADTEDVISEEAIWRALEESGCLDPVSDADAQMPAASVPSAQRMRNALILFQRTHGLCGTGMTDYATLCALGVVDGSTLLSGIGENISGAVSDGSAADAVRFDLRCRLLYDALASFVGRYPQAYDLYTLTACAAVLCGRTEDVRFPGGFDAVCRGGLELYGGRTAENATEISDSTDRRHDPLLLRAAEDALYAYQTGGGYDIGRGALYVAETDTALPENAVVCLRTRYFVFFR